MDKATRVKLMKTLVVSNRISQCLLLGSVALAIGGFETMAWILTSIVAVALVAVAVALVMCYRAFGTRDVYKSFRKWEEPMSEEPTVDNGEDTD